jgi:hypothetical protein
MSNDITFDISDVLNGLANLNTRSKATLAVYAETVAKDFESYAKQNRPWTDRTGRARQGLTGYIKSIPNGYRVIIAHTVDYGLWLEMAKNKKYAILEPTVRLKGSSAVKGMNKLISNLGG